MLITTIQEPKPQEQKKQNSVQYIKTSKEQTAVVTKKKSTTIKQPVVKKKGPIPTKKVITKNKRSTALKKPIAKRKVQQKTQPHKINKQNLNSNTKIKPKHEQQTIQNQDQKPFSLSQSSINFLQNELILPKKGSVKLTITVQPNGKIANITINEGHENKENAQYLISKLNNLTLTGFLSHKEQMISIVFSHSQN